MQLDFHEQTLLKHGTNKQTKDGWMMTVLYFYALNKDINICVYK
jgi:hypothetical protein